MRKHVEESTREDRANHEATTGRSTKLNVIQPQLPLKSCQNLEKTQKRWEEAQSALASLRRSSEGGSELVRIKYEKSGMLNKE